MRDFDARFGGQPYRVRSGEKLFEVTYRFQITPWLQLQPRLPIRVRSRRRRGEPARSKKPIGDAVVGMCGAVTLYSADAPD